jgi:hypothetical protein
MDYVIGERYKTLSGHEAQLAAIDVSEAKYPFVFRLRTGDDFRITRGGRYWFFDEGEKSHPLDIVGLWDEPEIDMQSQVKKTRKPPAIMWVNKSTFKKGSAQVAWPDKLDDFWPVRLLTKKEREKWGI